MRNSILLLFIFISVLSSNAQPELIIGQKQGLMFTDIVADDDYSCSWPNGQHGCSKFYYYDVNHDGTNDFYLVHAFVECNLYSYRDWDVYPIGNVEFLVDSMGMTPFNAGDSIRSGANNTLDFIYTVLGYDSVNNPIYDTAYLPRSANWLDTAHVSWRTTSLAHTGGGLPGCDGIANWALSMPDTNYFAFRLIEASDTSYGWFKAYSVGDIYFGLSGESFAITGDTGNYIISGTEEISRQPGIKLYPNPVDEKLFIESPHEDCTIEIFSIDGFRQTSACRIASGEVDVSALSAGVYFLHIHSKEGIITKRFIKQ